MGIVLLPMLLVFAVTVVTCVILGIKGAMRDTKETGAGSKYYVAVLMLSVLFSVAAMLLAFSSRSGERVYIFSLYLYMHFVPLVGLVVIANVVPAMNRVMRCIRRSLLMATVFIFPLADILQEYALKWFHITTYH